MRKVNEILHVGLFLVLCGTGFLACQDDYEKRGYPAPGTMQVVSVTPLAYATSSNTILNGSFEEYYAGAPSPTGPFSVPPKESEYVEIERSNDASDGRIALKQTWKKRDWGLAPDETFSVALDASSETVYRVEVDANVLTESKPYLAVYLTDKADDTVALTALALEPGQGYSTYTAEFSTGPYTGILLVARGPNRKSEYPCEVLWDNLRLAKASDAGKEVVHYSPLQPESDNLLANGSFDRWLPGDVAPMGFCDAGPLLDSITLFREERKPEGGLAAHQYWSASDNKAGTWRLFHVIVDNLSPNTDYILTFEANTQNTMGGRIVINALSEDNGFAGTLASHGIQKSGGFKSYTIPFQTEESSRAAIIAKGPSDNQAYPARVTWDGWKLRKAGN